MHKQEQTNGISLFGHVKLNWLMNISLNQDLKVEISTYLLMNMFFRLCFISITGLNLMGLI